MCLSLRLDILWEMKTKIWSTDSAFGANRLRSDTCSREKVRVQPVVIFGWFTTWVCGFCAGHGGLQPLTILSLLLDRFKQIIEFGVLFTDHFCGPTFTSSLNTKKIHSSRTIRVPPNLWERLTPIPVFSPSSALTQKTACQLRLINLLDTLPAADHK